MAQSYDDRDGWIWMDGEMLPWRDAKIHVLTHGLHYGGSVFEGERVYGGQVFKLREHSERFIRSGSLVDFALPMGADAIVEASKQVVEANKIVDGYVRPVAWRGSEMMAVSAPNCSIHVAFACWQWPKYFFPKGEGNKGIALKTSEWRRPDPRTAPVQSKAASNYVVGTMAKHIAERAGYDDALMLDYRGYVAESTGSNIFFVKDGVLRTPIPECFLNGITRQTIIQLAAELGYTVEETIVMPEELSSMEEVFVTGTAAEIMPVGKIDGMEYDTGPVTKRLTEAYADLVRQKQTAKTAVASR
jgi:branched-chain amino acid aminotransferase